MKLTRRGWIVLVIIPTLLTIAGLYWLSGHLWWVGDHYCLKTLTECYFPTK